MAAPFIRPQPVKIYIKPAAIRACFPIGQVIDSRTGKLITIKQVLANKPVMKAYVNEIQNGVATFDLREQDVYDAMTDAMPAHWCIAIDESKTVEIEDKASNQFIEMSIDKAINSGWKYNRGVWSK